MCNVRRRKRNGRGKVAFDIDSTRIGLVKQEAFSIWRTYHSHLRKIKGYNSLNEMIGAEVSCSDAVIHGKGNYTHQDMEQSMINLSILVKECLDGTLRRRLCELAISVILIATLAILTIQAIRETAPGSFAQASHNQFTITYLWLMT